MAKTSAERQQEYRARRNDGEGDRRINTWISSKADIALERLATHYGVTKRQMIERLVIGADDDVITTLQLDSPEWNSYFNVTA
jgi:hypothetical protein